ncbi:hypothetical protein LCGC14_0928300 [marine sediment metagenome]|uniref:Uncharacterized protein n=1 Tax=marine sediment metagenome TaxID=412755 RepID=A0A0F9NNV0_9ZZZZ
MDFFGWVLLVAALLSAWILIGAFRAHKKMLAEEERRTHRRTWERGSEKK